MTRQSSVKAEAACWIIEREIGTIGSLGLPFEIYDLTTFFS